MISPSDSAYQFFPCLVMTQLSRRITSTQYFTTSVSSVSVRIRRMRSLPISVVWIMEMFSNKSFMMVRKCLINEGASLAPAPTNYNFDIESKFLSLKIFFPSVVIKKSIRSAYFSQTFGRTIFIVELSMWLASVNPSLNTPIVAGNQRSGCNPAYLPPLRIWQISFQSISVEIF